MNPGPYFYPSKLSRGDGDGGGDGGGPHAQYVVVGGYCGEVANVKDAFAADFVRGRDRLEGVRSAGSEAEFEIRSRD